MSAVGNILDFCCVLSSQSCCHHRVVLACVSEVLEETHTWEPLGSWFFVSYLTPAMAYSQVLALSVSLAEGNTELWHAWSNASWRWARESCEIETLHPKFSAQQALGGHDCTPLQFMPCILLASYRAELKTWRRRRFRHRVLMTCRPQRDLAITSVIGRTTRRCLRQPHLRRLVHPLDTSLLIKALKPSCLLKLVWFEHMLCLLCRWSGARSDCHLMLPWSGKFSSLCTSILLLAPGTKTDEIPENSSFIAAGYWQRDSRWKISVLKIALFISAPPITPTTPLWRSPLE